MLLAGENCKVTASGMFVVRTNSKFPFARGRADDDARERQLSDDKLRILPEVLEILVQELENGNFSQDSADIEGFASVLEKLAGLNHRSPKVLTINRT